MPLHDINVSNCPGSEVILELLRAEHAQVKLRTDIIKQLITYNCSSKSESGKVNSGMNSFHANQLSKLQDHSNLKTNLSSNITEISRQFENLKQMTLNSQNQISLNNRESRHAKCFLSYDSALDPKPNRCHLDASHYRISQESSNFVNHQKSKSKAPNYSQVLYENLNDTQVGPTYSQFQREAQHKSTPKKAKAIDDGSYSSPIINRAIKTSDKMKPMKSSKFDKMPKYSDQSTITNKIEETFRDQFQCPPTVGYDYKLETHKLMQEVSDLKEASKRYENEKSDWINEKRRQIRILQQLRDASCDETKAAMKLTSWKPSDIECNPTQYEESKRNWLLCKKNQIELLERLRGVSLNEIRKGIERLSNNDGRYNDYDLNDERCRSMVDYNCLSQPGGQELYNSDKISVRICGPENKNECQDTDKININILMKSNNNISEFSTSKINDSRSPQKGGPSQNNSYSKFTIDKVCTLADQLCSNKKVDFGIKDWAIRESVIDPMMVKASLISSMSVTVKECGVSNKSIDKLKTKIENDIGPKLFKNTYNILSKLNCPELIVESAKGDAKEAENVLSYILEERKFNSSSHETSIK